MRALWHRFRGGLARLRRALFRGSMDTRLDDEVRFHVEMATAENQRRGMSPDAARRAALIAFGGAEQWKEAARDSYRFRPVDEMLQDLRQAVRSLSGAPSYTLAALLTLTLCIGVTTAIFSVVNAVLLRELPYPRPDRIVVLCERNVTDQDPSDCNTINPGNFLAWQELARSFEASAAYVELRVSVGGGGAEPVSAHARLASARIFDILGAETLEGRFYTVSDDRPGAPGVVVLSAGFWRRHFGGAVELVGQTILLDARPFTVIGVAEPGLGLAEAVDLWVPIRFSEAHRTAGGRYLRAIARLKDGATGEQASRELADLAAVRAAELPAINTNWTAHSMPLRNYLTGSSERTLWLMLGMVGVLLLLACANIANLTLARALDRGREIAVRVSLGASPGRIVRQLLTESLVLSVIATALGVALAAQGVRALLVLVPEGVTALSSAPIQVDWRVALFSASVGLGTAVLVGLLPALQAGRQRESDTLRSGGRTSGGLATARMRSGLVMIEVSLAFVLLIGAGLMLRSFAALRNVNLGFDASPVLTARVALPGIRYPSDTARQAFFRAAAERIAGLPGVTAAGWISWLPLSGQRASSGFNVDDRPPAPLGAEPVGDMRAVTPDYFAAMGIPLLEGRLLSEQDVAASPAVALVSASLARRFWPEESAIGHYLLYEWNGNERVEIVGVVGDVHHDGPAQAPLLEIYRPLTQFPYQALALVVRTAGDPVGQAGTVRGVIREMDRELAVADLQSMTALVRDAVGSTRLLTTLLALFGALGGVLAAIGVYGLMAYTVQQRRREFGIRLALGGRADTLVRHTVRRGLVLTLGGLGLGAVVAFLASRLMAQLLFGVVPTDAITFGLTFGLLGAIGVAATYLPARRAAQVNLVALLREE